MKSYCLLLSITLSCCCSAEDLPDPPSIHLNSKYLPNQAEAILTAGTPFTLRCTGASSVHWSSSAFCLVYLGRLVDPIDVQRADPRHTGTYRCGYTNQSLEHLSTWIHLYVKDPADPSTVFVTPRNSPLVKEGQDFLYRCLLTDPSVTDLTFQPEDNIQGSGQHLPVGMNVTVDPQRGALIQDVQRSFSGQYVCSGWKDGRHFISRSFHLLVAPRLPPPSVAIHQNKVVRLEGEKFEVTCVSSSTTHLFNVTWTHLTKKNFDVAVTREKRNSDVYISSTLMIAAVSQEDRGTYTCAAASEDGVTTATTHLIVLDSPFMTTYLKTWHANTKAKNKEISKEIDGNLTANSTSIDIEANRSSKLHMKMELIANVSIDGVHVNNISSNTTVEAYEGLDVILTFVTESYPPLSNQSWTKPTKVNNNNNVTMYQENYSINDTRSEASLLLRRVRQEDHGSYTFHFSNSFFSGSQNIDLRIYRSPSAIISVEKNTLTCSSSGYPVPTIAWYSCPGILKTCGNLTTTESSEADPTSEHDEENVRKHLNLPLSTGGDVTAECIASNQVGAFRKVFHLREHNSAFMSALIGAGSAAAILFLLLLVVFYKWRQKPKYEIRWKIIESTEGNHYTFVDPTLLPYNYKWEFPRDKLRLGAVLGSGAFGKVVEATAYGLGTDDVTRVAVKMLKPRALSEEREALMSELKILSHLGYHDNIVNLLGACTQGGPMLMITEYCSYGDLLNFLRARAQDFMASILSADEMEGDPFYKNMATLYGRLRSDSGISCCSNYQEMQPILGSAEKQQGVQMGGLSFGDLLSFSHQVAQGLDFLSTRNCIHRDVAARNVLLTDHRVAKICDFGLARDIQNDDSYIVQGNARLPVKWMAPESIFQCVYTVQSDVWSYGVLLWEIFSLGKSPYPNVAVDTHFYKMIKDGRHMTQPDFAPVEMYQLMTHCWSLEPTDRPTFKMICQLIDRLLQSNDDTNHQSYRNINETKKDDFKGGKSQRRGEEEQRRQREHHENDASRQAPTKNIYQLS
ncbi:hypothetical protein fugu_008580 [Takifugu bimaculatus]|uniref:receptor protein-tyrosine kinase n=1 Tax=Takifugu bimaculatus TaxID=433685 RepID=A0A4Z2AW54_9TELE|nr:hypothetical protein fugu_008580 [Takifugu bimaculatus]